MYVCYINDVILLFSPCNMIGKLYYVVFCDKSSTQTPHRTYVTAHVLDEFAHSKYFARYRTTRRCL